MNGYLTASISKVTKSGQNPYRQFSSCPYRYFFNRKNVSKRNLILMLLKDRQTRKIAHRPKESSQEIRCLKPRKPHCLILFQIFISPICNDIINFKIFLPNINPNKNLNMSTLYIYSLKQNIFSFLYLLLSFELYW